MTIFSQIIKGEIPCYKIAENDDFFAFLDIRPMQAGHTLVVPKKEIDYIFDMDDDDLQAMIIFAKRVAEGIRRVIPCDRISLSVLGLEVPHAHIHLVPINEIRDFSFSHHKNLSTDEMQTIAAKISAEIQL
jgi:histidine triad (HIT) family protein